MARLSRLGYQYPQGKKALEGINLTIVPGESVVILGGNGSGKSTLAKILQGLLKPTAGTIESRDDRGERGLLFQNPSWQIVSLVVEEDVAFGPENLGFPQKKISWQVDQSLGAVDLKAQRFSRTHDLSAGQQQRLAMAGVLALGTHCLILDEAESMLNPRSRWEFNTLLKELQQRGYTIIRITHFMEYAPEAERVLILHQGRIVADGPPGMLTEGEKLSTWRLTPPPACVLSQELLGGRPALTEEELAESLRGLDLPPPWFPPTTLGEGGKEIVCLKAVDYASPGGSPLLKNLHFRLLRGENTLVVGPTGSGKSTFLQVLNALLFPSQGEVRIFGENPLKKGADLSQIRQKVGLVMQQPERQLFANLVGDDVAFGPRQLGLEGRTLALRVKEALELMGLPYKEFRDRPCHTLSGGQKRKVALAGVLAMRPEVLLLDEPSTGLDPVAAEELELLLLGLQDQGITTVTVTHQMDQALRLGRRLLAFMGGQIGWDGPVEEFFRTQDCEKWGLDLPLVGRVSRALGWEGRALALWPSELEGLLHRGSHRD